ncbi:MAG: glycosyltransferase family 8 protein [Clostridia bacterium]|nr:glycosyltransferase family 8 protein [Clostridia bacterium]MBQ8792427.1 glycosyltransferase family 8 protein [Clostridia bacterium]
MKTNNELIPIFFASNNNYVPYLDVAITSILKNASKEYDYEITILNTGIDTLHQDILSRHSSKNVTIKFFDVESALAPIKEKLRDVHYFTLAAYYRLFIEKLFPQYDKALYLDCDIVVCGDISQLFNTNLEDKLVGAINEQNCRKAPLFTRYINKVTGIDPYKYFNSGVLVLNLKEIRKFNLLDKFIYLLTTYNFDTVMPDQDYLNILCKDRVKLIPNGWNYEAVNDKLEGKLYLRHYALGQKPWFFKDMQDGQIWWYYAKESAYYNKLLNDLNNFTEEDARKSEEGTFKLVQHAAAIINSKKTFKSVLFDKK